MVCLSYPIISPRERALIIPFSIIIIHSIILYVHVGRESIVEFSITSHTQSRLLPAIKDLQSMVKSRETRIIAKSAADNNAPDSKTEMDLSVIEDNWVIVKKQQVTIWIPPSPTAKQPTFLNTEPTQITRKEHSIKPEIPAHVEENLMTRKVHQSKLLYAPIRRSFNRCLLLDKKMRSANLEMKIQRAGGLSRWLISLGLSQFVQMFQNKRVGKFQLVNLTMKRLKDMGADPVGPRRKLMHAIDCISHSCRLKSIQTFC